MQTKGRYDTMELLSKQADWIGEGRLAEYARLREGQPNQIEKEMEILGVAMEKRLSFRGHTAQILDKEQVRLAILGRLAGCKWGTEIGILRPTGEALIVSLLRYCIALIGTGAYEKDMRRLEVCILNVLPRRVAGESRSARILVLHATAGLISVHNLYVQQCDALLDRGLRAENGSIQNRIARWTQEQFGITGWRAAVLPLEVEGGIVPTRIYRMPFFDFDLQECWYFCVLNETPRAPPQHKVVSTFFTEAVEAEAKPGLQETTYNFEDARTWMDVGLQVLSASKWRPDCAASQRDNIIKTVPPNDPWGLLIFQSPLDCGSKEQSLGERGYNKLAMGAAGGLHITTCAFFQDETGARSAWVKRTDGVVYTHGVGSG